MGQYDRKRQSQPKHGKPSDSGASKAAPPPPRSMPGWKGPSYLHRKKTNANPSAPAASEPVKLEHVLPLELERLMLEVFRNTFPASSDFEALKPTLQSINDALLRRDFDAAFATDEHLEAYAIRWSPSRALCYAQLLAWICAENADDACIRRLTSSADAQTAAKVICFGGGAAELMAFPGLSRYLLPSKAAGKPASPAAEISDSLEAMSMSAHSSPRPLLHLNLLDTADLTSVLSKLDKGLQTPPTLSKYASATARARNASFLVPGTIEHAFTRKDLLDCSTEDLRASIGPDPALLTLMFTLNELYMASMPRTTTLLRRLTEAAPTGSLLLVVDAPGAYSEIALSNAEQGDGTGKRKYLMSQLLDYALVPGLTQRLGQADSDDEKSICVWEKVVKENDMSYRLHEDLKYPVSLENMRIQVHLFRRL